MNKKIFIYLFVFLVLIFSRNLAYSAEQLQLLSYYPSPSGYYDALKAKTMIIGQDQSRNLLNILLNPPPGQRGVSAYFFVGRGQNSDLMVSNSGYVGIGTNDPTATLEINGNILRTGSFCRGYDANTHVNLGSEGSITGVEAKNIKCAAVIGGGSNTASGGYSTITGGIGSTASGENSVVSGGQYNKSSGNYSAIVGGYKNEANGRFAAIISGRDNSASGECSFVAGQGNKASGNWATISGGNNNDVNINGQYAAISGGSENKVQANFGAVSGGTRNVIESNGSAAAICGGIDNIAGGADAIVCGGSRNIADGKYSFAAGYYAQAVHDSSFVWHGPDLSKAIGHKDSNGPSTFNVYAPNGIYFFGKGIWLNGAGSDNQIHYDVAEYMNVIKNEEIEEGDIVSVNGPNLLGKSSNAYDDKIIGVISGKRTCSFYMGDNTPKDDNTVRLPIALVGIVYVKVNNENGAIEIGDPITSSSIQGAGMKAVRAGKIIGYAMEELKEEKGEILVFVNLSYYVPPEEYLDLKVRLERLENKLK